MPRRTKAERIVTARTAPAWAWDTIDETLANDAISNAFDKDLRTEISDATNALSYSDLLDVCREIAGVLRQNEKAIRNPEYIADIEESLAISATKLEVAVANAQKRAR